MASVNRAPFDLAEAESELVAGFHTEYSGLRWSFFFMAEYGSMFLVSGLAAILFFGGWNGPIPIFAGLADGPTDSWTLVGFLANLAGAANFILKGVVGVTVMMWARWTLPRLRIDQVMATCLKYCVPLSAFFFLGAMLWAVLNLPTGHDLFGQPMGEVREVWRLQEMKAAQAEAGDEAAATVALEPELNQGARSARSVTAPTSSAESHLHPQQGVIRNLAADEEA